MTIKMPKELKEWFQSEAEKDGRKMSNLALLVLTNYRNEVEKCKNKKS